jgi:predicted ribosome quality control (RQC) complex YloA/Tae2 family protein
MKESLAGFEVHCLVRELQSFVSAKLDKVYQGVKERKRDLTLQVHTPGEGKRLIRIILPGLIYQAEEKPVYGKLPGQFAVFMRKHLGNARIIAIEQRRFERIIEFHVENKNGRFTLLLELLPPGNALLLNSDGKIINLLEPQRHGQRLLRGGALYVPPPEIYDTKAVSEEEIVERLFTSDKDSIVKALASDLGFGSEYAEELCARLKIDKNRNDLKKSELTTIAKAVRALFDEKAHPMASGERIYPIAMQSVTEEAAFPSFSQAIEERIVPSREEAVVEPEKPTKTKKEKAKDVVATQERQLEGYKKAADENQAKGEVIYTHYQDIDKFLKAITADRKTLSWKEIKEKYKAYVKKIDENKGEITIELK